MGNKASSNGGGGGSLLGSSRTSRISDCQPGDVILIRQEVDTALGSLDPGLVRSLAATQRGGYFSAQQQRLAGWTHCGVILSHKSKRYLVLPSTHGIELFPAAKRIRRMQKAGAKVAVRHLSATLTDTAARVLKDLLQCAVYGCEWERYMPEVTADPLAGHIMTPYQSLHLPRSLASAARISTPPLPGRSPGTDGGSVQGSSVGGFEADDGVVTSRSAAMARLWAGADSDPPLTATPSGGSIETGGTTMRSRHSATASTRSDLTPFGREFIRTLMPRVWAALCSVPPQMEVELRRAFRRCDRSDTGSVAIGEVQQVLQDFKGAPVPKPEVDSFVRLMDATSDRVTLDDFLLALARRPLKEIPLEHDVSSILCGEFVATVYEMMGLLPTRVASTFRAAASRRSSVASVTSVDDGAASGDRRASLGLHDAGWDGGAGALPKIDFSDRRAPLDLTESKLADETAPGSLPQTFAALNVSSPFSPTAGGSNSKLDDERSPRALGAVGSFPFASSYDMHGSPSSLGSDTAMRSPNAAMRRLVTSSDISTLLMSPKGNATQPPTTTIMSRQRLATAASGSDGGSVASGTGLAAMSSGYDGIVRDTSSPSLPHLGESASGDGIASRSRAHASVKLPPVSSASRAGSSMLSSPSGASVGRPPTHAGGGGTITVVTSNTSPQSSLSPALAALLPKRKDKSSSTPGGTIIVIDSTCGDFRHFTPMTFSSHFEPKLRLLAGRLEPEALVETSKEDEEADSARETVKALTGGSANRAPTPRITPDTLMTTRTPPSGGATAPTAAALSAASVRVPSRATSPTPPTHAGLPQLTPTRSAYVIDVSGAGAAPSRAGYK